MTRYLPLALLLPVAFASAPQQPQPRSRSAAIADRGLTPADFPKLQKIADRVYVFSDLHSGGFGYLTNDLIVVTDAGVLVADGQGTPAVTQKLVDEIRRLTPQPIVNVVVCSEHGDHTGGNVSFPSSAVFFSSPASQAALQAQAANDRPGGSRTIVPAETVASSRTIRLGTTEIDIVYNGRAHTSGDLEVSLPAEKILFASEVFTNHIFPSMRTAYPSEWIATLERVAAIDAAMIVPGHGFVEDPATMQAEFVAFRHAMGTVVAEGIRLHGLNLPASDAVAQARWGEYVRWTGSERNAPIAIQRVFDELDGKLK
ncbi:MAG TPA: MBL fold metallo-hydrolase [Vicinamibacterales bacterium]|nr:MBL fold metallo-hydrolase [Vicinamibacterales bacterium]